MIIYKCKESGCWVARIGMNEFASRVSMTDAMCGLFAMYKDKNPEKKLGYSKRYRKVITYV